MNGYHQDLSTNIENSRNSLRRIARNDDHEFSRESIINLMEKFIKSVNVMDDTILVPCRLMDHAVGDSMDTVVIQKNFHLSNKKKTLSVHDNLNSAELFNLYTMLNNVKVDLMWGRNSEEQPEELQKANSKQQLIQQQQQQHQQQQQQHANILAEQKQQQQQRQASQLAASRSQSQINSHHLIPTITSPQSSPQLLTTPTTAVLVSSSLSASSSASQQQQPLHLQSQLQIQQGIPNGVVTVGGGGGVAAATATAIIGSTQTQPQIEQILLLDNTKDIKGHIRRPSTASVASSNSTNTLSDSESEISNENDSGIETETSPDKDKSTELAKQYRIHLLGLYRCLEQMTEAANYLTARYQSDVGPLI